MLVTAIILGIMLLKLVNQIKEAISLVPLYHQMLDGIRSQQSLKLGMEVLGCQVQQGCIILRQVQVNVDLNVIQIIPGMVTLVAPAHCVQIMDTVLLSQVVKLVVR